jgi:hypothetical protein
MSAKAWGSGGASERAAGRSGATRGERVFLEGVMGNAWWALARVGTLRLRGHRGLVVAYGGMHVDRHREVSVATDRDRSVMSRWSSAR